MSTSQGDFFKESRMSGFPNASLENIGDRVAGRITGLPRVIDNAFGKALVVDLANDAYPEGGRTWFIRAGQHASAVDTACGGQLAEGGWLEATLVELRDTGKGNPLKVISASYQAPQAKVDLGTIFGSQP